METLVYAPELIKVPHHELSYNEADRRDVNSYTVEEIKKFDKAQAVFYARATGLKETGMSVNEVALLYDLLEKKGACNIVELGRNFGTSTRLFLQHVVRHGGNFESWDLKHWDGLKESFIKQGFKTRETYYNTRPITEDYSLMGDYEINLPSGIRIDIRLANSITTPIQKNFKCDFLLIDTEHSTANALYEYGRWRQYLRSGAFVAFHDSTLPGVARAIEIIKEVEYAECGERFIREWVNERVDGYGIHILEWRG